MILRTWGRLEEALRCSSSRKRSAWKWATRTVCQIANGNQALILKDWGQLQKAFELHKKQEVLCRELRNRTGLELGPSRARTA